MSAIPFGFVRAVTGHIVLGQAISMLSLFGFIGLAGVVVNDSGAMMDFPRWMRNARNLLPGCEAAPHTSH